MRVVAVIVIRKGATGAGLIAPFREPGFAVGFKEFLNLSNRRRYFGGSSSGRPLLEPGLEACSRTADSFPCFPRHNAVCGRQLAGCGHQGESVSGPCNLSAGVFGKVFGKEIGFGALDRFLRVVDARGEPGEILPDRGS